MHHVFIANECEEKTLYREGDHLKKLIGALKVELKEVNIHPDFHKKIEAYNQLYSRKQSHGALGKRSP
jgi:hypothetical protein